MLEDHKGAVILLNASTGEILVMASHPNFDPNDLDSEPWILWYPIDLTTTDTP